MSRKITSGADVFKAASTSAPLRHSPATTNSGKFASSWRTPRRATGSSSAISAFHLACFTVWLRTQLAIWQFQYRDCTAFETSNDLERRSITVKRAQALPRVVDSMAGRHGRRGIDACAIVDNRELQHVTRSRCRDQQQTCVRVFCDAVTNRVLDQMLQRETRNGRRHQRLGNSELRSQAIGEARLLDSHILLHEI